MTASQAHRPESRLDFWFKDRPFLGRAMSLLILAFGLFMGVKIANLWMRLVAAIVIALGAYVSIRFLMDQIFRIFSRRSIAR